MDREQFEGYAVARNGVALFDLSSGTKLALNGSDCSKYLDGLVSFSIESMRNGQATNTLVLRDDGTLVAIVWLLKDDESFLILTDPEKRDHLLSWLVDHRTGFDVDIQDKTDLLACLSIVGPKAQELARSLAGDDIIGLPYLGFEQNNDMDCLVCRVGYTGEYEYRFIFSKDRLDAMRETIMKKGSDHAVAEYGTSLMDVLMLEMKSINQIRDIADGVTPLQAGLHWAIDFRKDSFSGREAVINEKSALERKLLLLVLSNGAPPAVEAGLFIGDEKVGHVVNHHFSPTLAKSIALASIRESVAWVGVEFDVETEGGGRTRAKAYSSPLFLTKTVTEAVL
ncbi:MAG: Aminomethyltransferase [Syntrophorhabdus sp. PtaB.Bin184]|nr:MAG: Aminomethyltransferase [Syntrophorhabdus sp. PtaB.Bin184]